MGGIDSVQQTELVFKIGRFWKYFDCPSSTEVIRERVDIYTYIRFHWLILETTMRDVVQYKWFIE